VGLAHKRGLSERRACTLSGIARSSLRYQSRLAAKDAMVFARMRELAGLYPRYGYRRIQIFLARDGFTMSAGRAYRLWRDPKLQVPTKRPRKRPLNARPRPEAPTGPDRNPGAGQLLACDQTVVRVSLIGYNQAILDESIDRE
jgi:putative transposase